MKKLNTEELNRLSINEFKLSNKIPLICILDNIRSQHNVGSIFRTSDAFRAEELILCGITSTPPNREINKTALGATESMKWSYEEDTLDAVNRCKSRGYHVIAVEQAEGSIALNHFESMQDQKIALVFGNEVHGVSDDVMAVVDGSIEIPQFGTKHSLNVSVTAGIVLWQMFLKLHGDSETTDKR